MKTAIIVQARFGSTRLPGKVLQPLAGRTVLEHVLSRCGRIAGVDEVVCATSDRDSDDPVAAEASRLGVTVFRGSEGDVLARYLGAAQAVGADILMRVTGDCPLIDPQICAAVLELRNQLNVDYASNNMSRLFPHGLDCEAFTRAALERAAATATDSYDREHVTPWLRREPSLTRANLTGPGWPANTHRWTLDYPADFDFLDRLFQVAGGDRLAHMQGILSVLASQPELATINSSHAVTPAAPNRPAIVFRFDADQSIGIGHAMRCATLSDRFVELGWSCFWAVTPRTAAFLGSRLPRNRTILLPHDDVAAQLTAITARIGRIFALVLDHYGLPSGYDTAARSIARRIIWIDDLADRPLDADLVINSTPGIDTKTYQTLLPPRAKTLLGGMAAPLRKQFAVARSAAMTRRAAMPSVLQRLLISFGGVDPLDGTSLAIDVAVSVLQDSRIDSVEIDVVMGSNAPHLSLVTDRVAFWQAKGIRIRLMQDVADMAGLMANADLCIGAPGTTTWERSCLGLPSLLIGIAENQRQNASVTARTGAAVVCGFLTTDARDTVRLSLRTALADLVVNPQSLAQLSNAAIRLSDGRGVDRIVINSLEAVPLKDGTDLTLRLSEPTDEKQLLLWQQASETRRFAFNQRAPTSTEHHAWFQAKLMSANDLLLIAESVGIAVGYVRLDWRGDNRGSPIYLISIATAPEQYRRGIGSAMLRLTRRLAPGTTLLAQIIAGNTASTQMFRGLGYELRPDGFYWSLPES